MKKERIIILILSIIFLTGCQREYNLIVNDNEIIEEINVVLPNNAENVKKTELNYYPIHANDNALYSKEVETVDENLSMHLKYTYSPKKFVNANSINECFLDKKIIVDNNKYYYFKLEKMKACVTDYNFDINIITDNKVLNHNADSVKGNKYIWHLRDDNKDTFNLEIKIAKGVKKNDIIISISAISVIILVVIIVITYVFSSKKKSNRI